MNLSSACWCFNIYLNLTVMFTQGENEKGINNLSLSLLFLKKCKSGIHIHHILNDDEYVQIKHSEKNYVSYCNQLQGFIFIFIYFSFRPKTSSEPSCTKIKHHSPVPSQFLLNQYKAFQFSL